MQKMNGKLIHKTELIAEIITKVLCNKKCSECDLTGMTVDYFHRCKWRIPIRKAASAVWRSLRVDQPRVKKLLIAARKRVPTDYRKYPDRVAGAIACDMPILIRRRKSENKQTKL